MKWPIVILLALAACVPPAVLPPPAPQPAPAVEPVCTRSPEAQTSWAASATQISCDSTACAAPFSKPTTHIQIIQGPQSIQRVVECWCCYEEPKPEAPKPPPSAPATIAPVRGGDAKAKP